MLLPFAVSVLGTLALSGVLVSARATPVQQVLRQDDAPTTPRLIRQNHTICDAGSSQWSGTIPIDEDRDMFFWYFESRHSPKDDPLIIWLNGGPGASSLLGAFHEIGPCTVAEDGKTTIKNDLSWTEFSNMLFIDQPIGVGFSDPQDTRLWTKNLRDGAVDLDKFLDVFLRDYFPELSGRSIHLACESFGGKYCPVYADMMRRQFSSLVLVNAMINYPSVALGLHDHFCSSSKLARRGLGSRSVNISSCEEMEGAYSDCERQGRLCELTYDTEVCRIAFEKCDAVQTVYGRHVVPGGENPYDDRTTCIDPPICGRLGMEEVAVYLNQDWVQNALGFKKRLFEPVNMDFNIWWSSKEAMLLPSTREIARLLDEKDTAVLVLNGNNDAIVNTEGILQAYNSLLWGGHAQFQLSNLEDWYYSETDGSETLGGQFKTSKNLTLVTVNEAGHMSPHDQPLAVSQLMQDWIKRASIRA
ncbi:carboxypeptidase Y [Dactylonectria estremocensis]|uniref:Carboxypeptidase Y n=1 Tax=Dactylonectria estremocensis TaxID=1079267 RepID=A0A9P9EUK3_9HYPO|nr:carboxypeptidase Y [Dactylonectria estremocensis]